MSKPLVIALRGPLGCGKTAAAMYLGPQGFNRVSFAEPLREVVRQITPDGQINKQRDRALLQFLGTEYFRGIDADYWVKKFYKSACILLSQGFSVVTDDCRFPNERALIKNMGGFDVYINTPAEKIHDNLYARDGIVQKGISGHASEAMNDPTDPAIDYHIHNNLDIGQLHFELDHMLIDLRKIADERENSASLPARQTGT